LQAVKKTASNQAAKSGSARTLMPGLYSGVRDCKVKTSGSIRFCMAGRVRHRETPLRQDAAARDNAGSNMLKIWRLQMPDSK
jgi:hypothetical protein